MSEQKRRSLTEDAVQAARAGADALFDPSMREAALQAAEEARERFARFLESSTARSREAGPAGLDGPQRASFDRALDAWLDWMRDSAEMAIQLGGPLLADLAGRIRDGDAIAFPTVVAGTATTTTFNVNNDSADPLIGVRFHCGDLRAASEAVIPMECMDFEPAEIDLIEPGTSYYVTTHLRVPEGTAPGVYHGVAMATELSDQHLPVSVDVVPRVVR